MSKNTFAHYAALAPKAENIQHFTLEFLDPAPVLMLAPATEVNKPFHNDVLKTSLKSATAIRAKGKITSKDVAKKRKEDRVRVSKHVLVGWKNVFDGEGKLVEFTPENGHDFIHALPDHIFDEVLAAASNAYAYCDAAIEEVSKN